MYFCKKFLVAKRVLEQKNLEISGYRLELKEKKLELFSPLEKVSGIYGMGYVALEPTPLVLRLIQLVYSVIILFILYPAHYHKRQFLFNYSNTVIIENPA